MNAFLPGFFLGLSLIAAIGAQNAFVLRQGLLREHVVAVCLTCAVSDALLVTVGVAGFGAMVKSLPWLELAFTLAGVIFLLGYAARSFRAAWADRSALSPSEVRIASLSGTIAACLAFTWLNPHVYLDTVVLLGSVSIRYGDERFIFGMGAVAASFVFFFSLGLGARFLAPFFAEPKSWRRLELAIGCVMTMIAARLLAGLF